MTRAEEYKHLAETVRARASAEESPLLRIEWENLAKSYLRLAQQTEENEPFDPAHDPIWRILGG